MRTFRLIGALLGVVATHSVSVVNKCTNAR